MKIAILSILILVTILCRANQASAAESASHAEFRQSSIVVVTHIDTEIEYLARRDLINIYMGKYFSYGNGQTAKALDIEQNNEFKASFYQQLTGLSLARVNAYWSRIKFTGRARPPLAMSDFSSIVEQVTTDKGTIAYLPESEVTETMKVIYRFEK